MKSLFNKVVVWTMGVLGLSVAGTASAAIPTVATDGITAIITDVGTLETAVWPLLLAVFTAFMIFKLFKKFAYRAI